MIERDTNTVPGRLQPDRTAHRRGPIVGLRSPSSGRHYPLEPGVQRYRVGSAPSCDIVVDDPCASRVHCVVERRPRGRLVVRDEGSKNGTYVNGNRVEIAELRSGGQLRIGTTTLIAIGRGAAIQRTALEQLRGLDPGFRAAVDMAVQAARTECSVLIIGETGTGKELVARVIHEGSRRAAGPFVALNCGGIARELVESELFGHERGAFTGATADRDGVFVQADGGTLFLDELGELPRSQQPPLLRALETRRIRRVGGGGERAVDVRLVSATNRRNLSGPTSPLRDDLYHRVATVVIELPPLRERPGDIPILARAFMDEAAPAYGTRRLGHATMRALCGYPWPGNVRELRHAIQRACALCDDELTLDRLLPHHARRATELAAGRGSAVPIAVAREGAARIAVGAAPTPATNPSRVTELTPFEAVKRDAVLDAYERYGSIRRAAAALGIAKSTFADYCRRYGIRKKSLQSSTGSQP